MTSRIELATRAPRTRDGAQFSRAWRQFSPRYARAGDLSQVRVCGK